MKHSDVMNIEIRTTIVTTLSAVMPSQEEMMAVCEELEMIYELLPFV